MAPAYFAGRLSKSKTTESEKLFQLMFFNGNSHLQITLLSKVFKNIVELT